MGVNIGKSTIGNTLRKRLRWSRKRLLRIARNKFTPANLARYQFFTQLQPNLNRHALVWVDEVGVHPLETARTHGWRVSPAAASACASRLVRRAPAGTPVPAPGASRADRRGRVSFISAMDSVGVLSNCTLPIQARARAHSRPSQTGAEGGVRAQGTTSAATFELWFVLVLLPALALRHPAGCAVVLDNASIHRPAVLRAYAAAHGANVAILFLSPYSPELNPVRCAHLSAAAGAAYAVPSRLSSSSPG